MGQLTTGTVLLPGLAALLGAMLKPCVRARTEAEGKGSVGSIGDRDWRNRILIVGLCLGLTVWTLDVIGVVANLAATIDWPTPCGESDGSLVCLSTQLPP